MEFILGYRERIGDDKESESVENQRDIINKFVEDREDLEFVDEYVDDGYTGTNFDRPSFQKLICDIEKKKINCVITKDLSRFGRDHVLTGHYLERYFPSNNIRYIAIGDGIDTETSAGMNFLTFKLSFNDYYSQDISNKVKAIKRRKAEKGEFIANFAPYGYKKDPQNKNHLLINEETAPFVRKIFDLYLQGKGTKKITKILNQEQIPTPASQIKSKKYKNCKYIWTHSTVHRILTNPIYIGTIEGMKTQKVNYKVKTRIKTPKNKRIYVENRHEAIISKEDFDRVQMKLHEPIKCRDRENFNPLKKFVYCGICRQKGYNESL